MPCNHHVSRFLCVVLLFLLAGCSTLPDLNNPGSHLAPTPTVTPNPLADPRVNAIDAALRAHVAGREDMLAFLLYTVSIDHVTFSADGSLALVWLALFDPDTGELVPADAGLAIARWLGEPASGGQGWVITVQADPDWTEVIAQVPGDLLSDEMRVQYTAGEQALQKAGQVYTGYRLPWEAGRAVRVSGSIGHVFTYKTCPTTCMYAFDFADGTMFPVLAAKAGTVKYAVWQYPNGNTEHTNYLVLEDTTTNPVTYQVYYHLAQDSIPPALRVRGAYVYQGQFIANADDTGASSAHHLHFHVHTNPYGSWGTSVDIVFDEVTTNGGRPRTCLEARAFPDYGNQCMPGNYYVSQNGDNALPTGELTAPPPDMQVESPYLTISGYGQDDYAVNWEQLYISTDGKWRTLGNPIRDNPFTVEVDLCQLDVKPGPFLVAMAVVDKAGKVSADYIGTRVLEMKYDCNPPPTPTPIPICVPASNQAALYMDTGFVGICQVVDIGEYADPALLGLVGNDDLESIVLGEDVMAVLYAEPGLAGQSMVIQDSVSDLSATAIGANQVSSLVIAPRVAPPAAPRLRTPTNAFDMLPVEGDAIVLNWEAGGSPAEYRCDLTGPDGYYLAMDWRSVTSWPIGNLKAGTYHWTVLARNLAGESQASMDFSVVTAQQPASAGMAALPAASDSTAILLKWQAGTGDGGIDHFEVQYRVNGGTWTDWQRPLPGNLRQAWFFGEPGSLYEFRLRSVDASGVASDYPEIAEAAILVESTCRGDEYEYLEPSDNAWTGAVPLDVDSGQQHNICLAGDEDWVVFPAQAGQGYKISANPLSPGVSIALQLVGTDRYTVLDEFIPAAPDSPARLEWIAPADGLYYLRLRPADPRLAGTGTNYEVRVDRIIQIKPTAVACSALLLPLVWLLVKFYSRMRKRRASL